MTPFGRGVLSNLAGVGLTAAMQLIFTPLFLRCVGVEGYGFIGFFITLQAVLQVLDFGFAPTIGRWLARFSAGQEDLRTTRDLARTLELASWTIALLIGCALIALAVPLARIWFAHTEIAPAILQRALVLMACTITAQWPAAFYQSGLLGLGRSVEMNVAKGLAAVLSAGGAALVLLYVSPTVPAYFAVQLIAGLLHAVALRILFWHGIAGEERPRFRPEALRVAARFAAGMTGITACAVLVTQIDRVILSRLVPLEELGCYALGWVVAGGLAIVIVPVHNTLFPQFSSLFAAGDDAVLRRAYHSGARTLSVLVLPLASVVALFAEPLLRAWTGDASIAARTAPMATLLVIGTMFNALMHPPYALQLASGSTRLPFLLTVGQLVFMIPAVTLLALHRGAFGAAFAWPAMNALYLIVGSVATHRLWLPGAQREWLVSDVGLPMVGALIPAMVAREILPVPASRVVAIAAIGAILCVSLLASWLLSKAPRPPVVQSADR